MSLSIFIGYVGKADKKFAQICERRLSVCKQSPVLSEETYEDEDVRKKIIKQLKGADRFVAVHSSRSLESAWLHQELGFFLGRHGGRIQGIHFLTRAPKSAKDQRNTALCCSEDYLSILRMRRESGFSEKQQWSIKNKHTLESALDMLVSRMISEQRLKTRRERKPPSGNHSFLKLRMEFECCGRGDVEIPFRSYHGGWVIRFLASPVCPRCGRRYGFDTLTWEPISLSPQPKTDKFLIMEYELYERLRNMAHHGHGGLPGRTSHHSGYYSGRRLRQ
jgi:hypothetical protein